MVVLIQQYAELDAAIFLETKNKKEVTKRCLSVSEMTQITRIQSAPQSKTRFLQGKYLYFQHYSETFTRHDPLAKSFLLIRTHYE